MTSSKSSFSRRDFLKSLTAAGAAGMVMAGLPALDQVEKVANPKKLQEAIKYYESNEKAIREEFLTDPAGRLQRPPWVRTVEQPTVEIKWDQIQRFNERMGSVRGPGMAKYVGQAEVDRLNKIQADNEQKRIVDKKEGYNLRDWALYNAEMYDVKTPTSFIGPQQAVTPEKRGVPKWTGTPEEASRMLRAAMRHFGAAQVAFLDLDDHIKKLIYSVDPDGKEMVFENVDQAYETDTKRVIPSTAKWVIVFTIQMSLDTLRFAPTVVGAQTTLLSYGRSRHIFSKTQEFMRGLGYQCLGEASVNALGIAPALGVMSGLGELSRLNRLITPEYGPMVRVFKMVTDLPLATDKPIDAGIMQFCKSCKKCAQSCPASALSFDTDPTWTVRGGWNNPGHRAYFEDSVKCLSYWRQGPGTNCGICFAVCPFSKGDKAWVHTLVKASVATVPFVDGLLRQMDDTFGYGTKSDSAQWWDMNLPEYGIDTTLSTRE